jgi:ribokinase
VVTDDEIKSAAQITAAMGAKIVIITLGFRGAYLHSKDVQEFIPGFAVDAIDTTAAGDIFCGSLAVAIAEGKSLQEGIRFASAASAICVTRLGAQPSAPDRREIDQFLENNFHESAYQI